MFRITFQLLDKYSDTPPSNIFLRAQTIERASEFGEKVFKDKLIDHGTPDATFDMTVYASSEEEAKIYSENMKRGTTTNRSVN